MEIKTKKCDVCGTKYESDERAYQEFQVLTNRYGEIKEICEPCVSILLSSVREPAGSAAD